MLFQEIERLPTGWRTVLSTWFQEHGKSIEENYKKEAETCGEMLPTFPPKQDIFRCFRYFHPEQTKVVIIGQDPYHGPKQAIGLCFGVDSSMKKPPSLKNIEKELQSDLSLPLEDTTLEKWAKQGVLLLNAALTVRQQTPLAHMKWWHLFTDFIVDYINRHCTKVVFVAWGAFAHKKLGNIDLNKHHLLISSHPSPFSVSRMYRTFPSFKGSRPFSRVNEHMDPPIQW